MLAIVADRASDASLGAGSNEALLAAVAQGDRRAFAALYDATAPRVLGLARRLLVDHAQAEEVAQEVYLEIWQTATRYQPTRGSALTWMLTMTHRRAVDRIRSAQASRDRDLRVGAREYVAEVDDVADAAEIAFENARVQQALGRLTELQRQAVTLAYYKGLSHSEVAALLRVPLGTVKTRLRDGMIRLRDELGVTS